MTVREMIEMLQSLDNQDFEIYIDNECYGDQYATQILVGKDKYVIA